MTWKYIPTTTSGFDRKRGGFFKDAPVTSVRAFPPGQHPAGRPIRADFTLVEIETPVGVRYHGFADACITARLKMAVKLAPGQERDEVVATWPNAPAKACVRSTSALVPSRPGSVQRLAQPGKKRKPTT